MRRTSKGGILSNNKIVYNYLVNKKTKNITEVPRFSKGKMTIPLENCFNNIDFTTNVKINCNYLYHVSVSNRETKMLNRRDKYYKITDEDFN
jgi:hypothetical protein